ncbi:uncharacterized protein LOC121894839 isoform X2 [Thunnus maccoyii]|uniref:uncharacterized protein LOC121894839 isoform X2 n=1 Tax=Thunnus maccoyii TaxID=8240 RepID=UPI001C4B2B0B|nr:uncharacterized protein LOC121894839 isoform X2 [Thunnus maccoyii]
MRLGLNMSWLLAMWISLGFLLLCQATLYQTLQQHHVARPGRTDILTLGTPTSPPPPVQTLQWDTAGLVSHHCGTCYIDKSRLNSDTTGQHVTAAKAIPHVSQVNKMDLLLCCFSQNCSCDFSVFGSLA